MAIGLDRDRAGVTSASGAGPSHVDVMGIRVPLRWKLLGAFAGAFTVVFVALAIWIFQYTSATATARLETRLRETAIGGASIMDASAFAQLVATVPATPDASNPTGLGYPDSPLYLRAAQSLYTVFELIPDSQPYSYFRDPSDGRLYFAASAGALTDPLQGVPYRVPVDEIVRPATYERMEQGLTQTTDEPAYTDDYGSWISTYSPILDESGATVGAVGVDYPLAYLDEVKQGVQRQLYPVLGVSYLVLLALVLLLSRSLARPLNRLTAAARAVAAGDYGPVATPTIRTRFPDEMVTLGESFSAMAARVAARERSLTHEVQLLRDEIDESRRGNDAT